jgi:branched-chain amino acid transport system permease protein
MNQVVVTRSTTTSRIFGVFALAVVAAFAVFPMWGSDSVQRKLIELFVLIALSQMWNLLAGFAGVVSVGQQAFVGLGAYGMIIWVNNNHLNL